MRCFKNSRAISQCLFSAYILPLCFFVIRSWFFVFCFLFNNTFCKIITLATGHSHSSFVQFSEWYFVLKIILTFCYFFLFFFEITKGQLISKYCVPEILKKFESLIFWLNQRRERTFSKQKKIIYSIRERPEQFL